MGARSEIRIVDQPFPVVFDAFVKALPGAGFDVTGIDPDRGWISLSTRNHRLTLAVGAIDAITTEWVATAERQVALGRDKHDRHFGAIDEAVTAYLAAYYPSARDPR